MTVLGFPPPGEVWSENRAGNWRKNMRLHKTWADCVAWYWRTLRKTWTPRPCLVLVTLTFPTSRRRDPHNYVGTVCKAIVDGLVHAGVFPDDTAEWVTVPEPALRVGEPWVAVRIEDRELAGEMA
jgi:Holliday junction resolvase RusA-like endonuclease